LSALTKILIILLAFSSFFLCGIVVTYVATEDNYKEKYDSQRKRAQVAIADKNRAEKLLEERKNAYEQQEDKLNAKIALLVSEAKDIGNKLTSEQRTNANLLKSVSDMTSVVETSDQTAQLQTQLFKDAQAKLQLALAKQEKDQRELDELSKSLMQKMAIIDDLEIQKKRLAEEKVELQAKLANFLQPAGKVIVEPLLVTPKIGFAQPVDIRIRNIGTSDVGAGDVGTRDIGLHGLITDVKMKHSMAQISIGIAHGVKENMKFYVTRDSKFVCEIRIIDVDNEKSVGLLERVELEPRVGDTIATNL